MFLLRARLITKSVFSMSYFVGQNISCKDLGGNLNLGDARVVCSRESQKGNIAALTFVAVIMIY